MDIPATVFISSTPKMCLDAAANKEIIHSVPLASQATPRHDNFDNMREVPLDEFVARHAPRLPSAVPILLIFFKEREPTRPIGGGLT